MIGVLDSGVGGLVSYLHLRRLLPRADIAYLADRGNAPYGTKSEEELVETVSRAILALREIGADPVLLACCSASTVHHLLPWELRQMSIPILGPAARVAASAGKRIAVIATSRTVSSGAFSRAIREINPSVTVTEISAQPLVSMIECGARDGNISKDCSEYLNKLCKTLKESSPDALVLGCTHFSRIENTLGAMLPGTLMISPAKIGAEALAGMKSRTALVGGSGKSLFTEGIAAIARQAKMKGRKKCQNTEEAASTTPLPRSLQ